MKFLRYFFVAAFMIFGFAACDGGESDNGQEAEKETMIGKDPEANNDKNKVEFEADEDGGSLSVETEETDISINSDDGN